jgi:hypothetical protein
LLVYAFIETAEQSRRRHAKNFANPKERGQGDGPSRFHLLPVSRGEAERDHIFLTEPLSFSQRPDPLAKPGKEFCLIWHLRVCKVPRAETPRAD